MYKTHLSNHFSEDRKRDDSSTRSLFKVPFRNSPNKTEEILEKPIQDGWNLRVSLMAIRSTRQPPLELKKMDFSGWPTEYSVPQKGSYVIFYMAHKTVYNLSE